MKKIPRDKQSRNGKDYYLLGRRDGKKVWLESASFDCGWYWGFGYVETFNRQNPKSSTDIMMHAHWDGYVVGKQESWDEKKNGFVQSDYFHHLNSNTFFSETTLTDAESWLLAELMEIFYVLRKTAEVLGRGGAHVTSNPLSELIKNEAEVKRINEIVLPKLFEATYRLLAP